MTPHRRHDAPLRALVTALCRNDRTLTRADAMLRARLMPPEDRRALLAAAIANRSLHPGAIKAHRTRQMKKRRNLCQFSGCPLRAEGTYCAEHTKKSNARRARSKEAA